MQNLQFRAQGHFFAWGTNCQESNPLLRRIFFQPPLPISQTLRKTNAIFICIWNHSVLQNGELSFPSCRNFSSPYFVSQYPKCRIILFQYTNFHLCAKFGDLKPTIDEKRRPQIRTCFWARRRNKIPERNCNFLSTKCFKNVYWSLLSSDCVEKSSKPRVMLQDRRGDQPSKNRENLDFWSDSARVLAFSSQCHAMWS